MNELHFGDNLDVLRAMPAESVDLIYLDPPFNSNANYNVLYGTKRGGPSQAQSHAFEDTWKWGRDAQRAIDETAERHLEAGSLLDAFQKVFGNSNMMAYLAMMTVRLIEMRRVLNSKGSLYLHCDPTASHYLKLILDAIFGPDRFQNEIIWKRHSAHNSAKRYGPVHDVLFFYTKSNVFTWTNPRTDYAEDYLDKYYKYQDGDGRLYWRNSLTAAGTRQGSSGQAWRGYDPAVKGAHWKFTTDNLEALDAAGKLYWPPGGGWPQIKRYRDELKGLVVSDIWDDIDKINPAGNERLGYSTQKPLALLERIILASSNKGDVVLDPFCGCGTAVEASQNLGRNWIGIDVTYLAIHVIEGRLVKAFGPSIKDSYKIFGRPRDANDARALAGRDWLEFQKWAVFTLGGIPKDRPGADGGIDGIIRYHRVGIEQPNRAVVSVKGGLHVGVDAIHKLKSVVQREGAEIGVLVCLDSPTPAMVKEAASERDVGPPSRRVAKLQILTVDMLFQANPVDLPGMIDTPEAGRQPALTPPKRSRKRVEGQTEMLFPIEGSQPVIAEKRKGNRPIRPVEIEVTRSDRRKAK
ncbi:DNA methyltransferase [Mesorhizobium sp. CO1-1-8]|uniref:DNA methyltransferase n=1 Tax=Mesorhizobium sp. CO1-1-8 TaxID=2876631 RepID=UPI001CD0F59B|nr:DNA methyltransferase [Mesorhizobium sp. CO1-1-8]MBZ9775195.1 restriction endonuclease [Mesorhizobium sp. CO1-1-8]